jgi:hypothetical protein
MFSFTAPFIDLTQAFIALSRRVSAANAHFVSGDSDKGMQQLGEAMKIIEQVEQAQGKGG